MQAGPRRVLRIAICCGGKLQSISAVRPRGLRLRISIRALDRSGRAADLASHLTILATTSIHNTS